MDDSYIKKLVSGSALDDGTLTNSEMSGDPQGQALLEALSRQIASELGVSQSEVTIHGLKITDKKSTRRSLEAGPDMVGFSEELESLDPEHVEPEMIPAGGDQTPAASKAGYYATPSMEEQERMSPSELSSIRDMVIGRTGFGEVQWLEEVDVRSLDIFDVVQFERAMVNVYSDERDETTKPAIGHGLNKPAIVTLEQVFPPTQDQDFEAKLRDSIESNGSHFVSYDHIAGKLRFQVEHW